MKITRETESRIESAKTIQEKIDATKLSYVENCVEKEQTNDLLKDGFLQGLFKRLCK